MWEKEEIVEEMLKKDHHLIDKVSIHMLIMVIKSQLCTDWDKAVKLLKESNYDNVLDYDLEIKPDLPTIITTKEKSIN